MQKINIFLVLTPGPGPGRFSCRGRGYRAGPGVLHRGRGCLSPAGAGAPDDPWLATRLGEALGKRHTKIKIVQAFWNVTDSEILRRSITFLTSEKRRSITLLTYECVSAMSNDLQMCKCTYHCHQKWHFYWICRLPKIFRAPKYASKKFFGFSSRKCNFRVFLKHFSGNKWHKKCDFICHPQHKERPIPEEFVLVASYYCCAAWGFINCYVKLMQCVE